MVAYASNQAGTWATPTIWTPNGTPGAGDTVTITHAVTDNINRTIGAGAGSAAVTLNSGGSLEHLPPGIGTTITFTVDGDIIINTGGEWKAGSVGAGFSATKQLIIDFNQATSTVTYNGGEIHFYGDPAFNENADLDRTTLNAQATSGTNTCVFVDDIGLRAGGGDKVAFASDTNGWAGGDLLTTTGYVSGTKTATFATNFTANHAAGTLAVTLTRNIVFQSAAAPTRQGTFSWQTGTTSYPQAVFDHCEFWSMGNAASHPAAIYSYGDALNVLFDCCTFHENYRSFYLYSGNRELHIADKVLWRDCHFYLDDVNNFRIAEFNRLQFEDCTFMCGGVFGELYGGYNVMELDDCIFDSLYQLVYWGSETRLSARFRDCDFRRLDTTEKPFSSSSVTSRRPAQLDIVLENCLVDATMDDPVRYRNHVCDTGHVTFIDNDQVAGTHRIYKKVGDIYRDDVVVYAGDSGSMRFEGMDTGAPLTHLIRAPVAGGIQIDVQCYCRKDSSYNGATRPSITVSGVGVTAGTATMTDVDDIWEQVSVTVTPARSGFLDIMLWTDHDTGLAYFDAPNVVRS